MIKRDAPVLLHLSEVYKYTPITNEHSMSNYIECTYLKWHGLWLIVYGSYEVCCVFFILCHLQPSLIVVERIYFAIASGRYCTYKKYSRYHANIHASVRIVYMKIQHYNHHDDRIVFGALSRQ